MSQHPATPRGLRRRLALLITLALVLAACNTGSIPQPQTPDTDAPALLSDSMLDSARLETLGTLELLSPRAVASVPAETELTLAEAVLEPQNVLPDTQGFVAFIRENPNADPPAWAVFSYNQATPGSMTRIYNGRREIQSIAISGDGDTLLLSMRQNATDPASPFQVWHYTVSSNIIVRLTNTASSNTHVSLSADGNLEVWEGTSGFNGMRGTFLRDATSGVVQYLGSDNDETQASLSGNGKHLVFVRSVGAQLAVVRFDRVNNTASTIVQGASLSDPSVSNKGDVAWLTVLPTGRHVVRLRRDGSASFVNVVGNTNPINSPSLTSDGKYLAFGLLINNRSFVRMMDLTGATPTFMNATVSNLPLYNSGVVWQLPVPLPLPGGYRLSLSPSGVSASSAAGTVVLNGLPIVGHDVDLSGLND